MSVLHRIAAYVRRERLLFAVYGGFLAVTLSGAAIAGVAGRAHLAHHILDRELVIHLAWGALLWIVLNRLLMTVENRTGIDFGWIAWYFIPIGAIVGFAALNEWALALTPIPDDCLNPGFWGGDWARAKGDALLRMKSPIDLFGWTAGAAVAANIQYKVAERAFTARCQYLA